MFMDDDRYKKNMTDVKCIGILAHASWCSGLPYSRKSNHHEENLQKLLSVHVFMQAYRINKIEFATLTHTKRPGQLNSNFKYLTSILSSMNPFLSVLHQPVLKQFH